jgi:hypothetical protein
MDIDFWSGFDIENPAYTQNMNFHANIIVQANTRNWNSRLTTRLTVPRAKLNLDLKRH